MRPDRDEHFFAVLGEDDVAGPVPAAAKAATAWNVGNNHLRSAAGSEVAVLIGESDDGIGVGDIDIPWIRPGRIEGDAKWLPEILGEYIGTGDFALSVLAQNFDPAGSALGDEQIAVGGGDYLGGSHWSGLSPGDRR